MSIENVKAFLGDGVCLLVEPSPSFSASLQSLLAEIGVPLSQVIVSRKYEDALKVVADRKPRLLVTEYDLPNGAGLSLIEQLEQLSEESQRIAIIVTKNSSDSAVAEAAKGAVDAFILKPFSTEVFRAKLLECLARKTQPSDYQKQLSAGRALFNEQKYPESLKAFQRAKPLDPKPSLACFGEGQSYERLEDDEKALAAYREGRKLTPLHYKCLVGEFDLLMKLKRFDEAYQGVPELRDNYPIPPGRLGDLFTAAVFTYHFDDLHRYHEVYLNFDMRSPYLVKMMSVGFMTAGRFYLQRQEVAPALKFFEMGMSVRGREITYLESIFDELMRAGAVKEADTVLNRVLPADVGTKLYNQMRFRMEQRRLPVDQWVERGRRLIQSGEANAEIYRLVVEGLTKMGRATLAESVIAQAVKEDPELRVPLYAILEGKTTEGQGE